MTGKATFILQVEVSPPQADDLGRVRQITQEKEALAQQRAHAEQARQVHYYSPCCNQYLAKEWQPHYSSALLELLACSPTFSTTNKVPHMVPRHQIRLCDAVLLLELSSVYEAKQCTLLVCIKSYGNQPPITQAKHVPVKPRIMLPHTAWLLRHL